MILATTILNIASSSVETDFTEIAYTFCSPLLKAQYALYWAFFLSATTLATSYISSLSEMEYENSKSFPYKLCEIRHRNYDLAKRWYVEFYVWDQNKEKLSRKVDYSINRFATVPERMQQARFLKREIDAALMAGKIIKKKDPIPLALPAAVKPKHEEISAHTPLPAALAFAVDIKCAALSQRSASSYRSIKNIISIWIKMYGLEELELCQVTPAIMNTFFDYLIVSRKVDNITHNNYLLYCRALFNLFVKREILAKNPCKEIVNLPEQEKSHIPFNDDQRESIKEYLVLHDRQLLLFCTFMYYTFVRRSELRYLQVKNIQKKKIHIPAYIFVNGKKTRVSKNGKSETVVIPDGLEKVINGLDLRNYPPDYFVFGANGNPGPGPLGISNFSNKHIKALRALGFPKGYTLYSWKHTGVVKLYMAIKDIRKVQQQCRHSSISITEKYLRGLGLFDNEEVQAKFPSF